MKSKILNFWLNLKKDESISYLGKGIFISFFAQGFSFAFSTILHIFLARAAGVENYGIYAYSLSWVLIFVVLSKFGFGTTVLKYVASYEANKDWGLLRGVIIKSHQYSLALNFFFGTLAFLILYLLKQRLDVKIIFALQISIVLGFIITHLQIIAASLLSLRKVLLSKLSTPVLRPIILLVIVLIFLKISGEKLSGANIILLDICTHIILICFAIYFLWKKLPGKDKKEKIRYDSGKWLRISTPLFFVSILHIIIRQTDILMVGSILDLKAVGVYNAALKLCFLISFSLNATTSVVAPMISRLFSMGKKDQLRRVFRFSRILLASISVPVSIMLFCFGSFFLSFFGKEFISGNIALKILIIGKLVNVIAGPVGFLYTMTGNHFTALKVLSVTAVLNVLLNLFFINFWGINGAAVASSVSLIFWNVSLIFFSKRKFGFWF